MLINEAFIRIGTVDFGNETSNQIYRWVSFIFLCAAYVASHWFNNDFTEEACQGTAFTRQLKKEQTDEYIGERFLDETVEDIEEAEDDE